MITPGTISTPLKDFIIKSQQKPVADSNAAIDAFCKQLETIIINAIKQATITIPISAIQVTGGSGPSVNVTPIILAKAIQ